MARENNNNNEDEAEIALWRIIKFWVGVFWKLFGNFLFGFLRTSLPLFLAFLLAFIIYCLAKGVDFNDVTLGMEIIGNAFDEFLEAIKLCFPDIEKYLMLTTLGLAFIQAVHQKREEKDKEQNTADNSSDSSNSTNNSLPSNSPRHTGTIGTRIKYGLYTDNFDVSYGYKNINGQLFVNSIKISCDIHNEHYRTEKVIFESCVFIPAINYVYILPLISYNIMPCDVKKADNPCPVDISPTLFDLIQQERIKKQGFIGKEEKWIIRITTNRKTAFEFTFNSEIV